MKQVGKVYYYENKVYGLLCEIGQFEYKKWEISIHRFLKTKSVSIDIFHKKCSTKRECLKLMMEKEKEIKNSSQKI